MMQVIQCTANLQKESMYITITGTRCSIKHNPVHLQKESSQSPTNKQIKERFKFHLVCIQLHVKNGHMLVHSGIVL